MKLSVFINAYASNTHGSGGGVFAYFPENNMIVTKSHIIEDLEVDDPLFNKYGVMYAMRHCLFLMSPKFVQNYIEYLFKFSSTYIHAKQESFLNPYSVNIEDDDFEDLSNPYNRNYDVTYPRHKCEHFMEEFVKSEMVKRHFDDVPSLIENVNELREKYGGIRNPIVQDILDASILRNRLMYGERVNLLDQSPSVMRNITKKNNVILNVLNRNRQETVTHISENLLCMFNLDVLEGDYSRLYDYVFMSPKSNGYLNIFLSWSHFKDWCLDKSDTLHRVIQYFNSLDEPLGNIVSQHKMLQELTRRDASVLAILKPQILEYENNLLCIGTTAEEISKNYNRQKLNNSLQSIIKNIIGE